jgi:threonine dehydratase
VVGTDRADTFVDGVACRAPDEDAIAAIVAGAARIVRVSEDDCAEAVRLLLHTTHNLAEPAGAIATAALMMERDRQQGRRVAVVMSGGNLDATLMPTLISGGTPAV